jgi:SulP family sulfate permease
MGSLSSLAMPGTSAWIEYAIWLAILAGAIQIILGALRGTWLFNLVSLPVLNGFTQAATLLIIFSQVPHLLGVPGTSVSTSVFQIQPLDMHAVSAAFGLSTLAVLLVFRQFRPRFPAIAFAALVGALISWGVGFAESGGKIVGDLPVGLPALNFPSVPSGQALLALLPAATTIACISFVETLASARNDSASISQPWSPAQEAIGQGLAKIASGLSGSFPVSTSFSRSALNLYAGARTRWATLIAVALVALFVEFAIGAMQSIPMAVLAAIIITPLLPLLTIRPWLELSKISKADFCIGSITLLVTLAMAPSIYWGVAVGVTLAILKYIWTNLHPRIIEVGRHADGSLRDRARFGLSPLLDRCLAVRIDASLDFVSAARAEAFIVDRLRRTPEIRCLCLFASGINSVDPTGVDALKSICERANVVGIDVIFCALKAQPEDVLKATGVLTRPLVHNARTEDEALSIARRFVK